MRTRSVVVELALVALSITYCGGCTVQNMAGAGGSSSTGGQTASAGTSASGTAGTSDPGAVGKCASPTAPTAPPAAPAEGMPKAPCDIYAADGGPCVAAHSTVRALYGTYAGPLYQVKKGDGSSKDITPLTPGGFANSADQDTFCGTDACTISIIYDQSGWANHLTSAPAGGAKTTPDTEANAKAVSATFSGHKVYGVHVVPGVGYRNNNACGTAEGDNAETEYMVVAGDVFNGGCCFDYGNMERNSRDNGEGTMEAVYFGKCVVWGKGAGETGPWVMGDLENGLWAGDSSPYNMNTPMTSKYVTAMVKGGPPGMNKWTIKNGDAQSGVLNVPFDGKRPGSKYNPMRKEGAIGMGTGGDNSSSATGNFFEGVMTAHYSSNTADDAVQASIVAAYAP